MSECVSECVSGWVSECVRATVTHHKKLCLALTGELFSLKATLTGASEYTHTHMHMCMHTHTCTINQFVVSLGSLVLAVLVVCADQRTPAS